MNAREPQVVQLRCPACSRWLAEVVHFGRVVCAGCGAEVTFRSREQRRLDGLPTPQEARS